MQDGIIKGNGNSRYLKSVAEFLTLYPTYEDFAQALMAGNLPIDLNGINAEGWNQQGTLLNKASLLKDATAALYGFGTDAVPDEVLALLAPWQLIQSYKAAGSYTFTVPDFFGDGLPYELGVYMMGGGGAGGSVWIAGSSAYGVATGGAAGYGLNKIFIVTPGQGISSVVGAGGGATTPSDSGYGWGQADGKAGGTTSFNGVSVPGGSGGNGVNGGTSASSTFAKGADGGQGSDSVYYGSEAETRNFLYGGGDARVSSGLSSLDSHKRAGTSQSPAASQNWFDNTMISLCAGGWQTWYGDNGRRIQTITAMPDGTKGGNGGGVAATGNGNGGGGRVNTSASASGAGSPGAIYIYARKVVQA